MTAQELHAKLQATKSFLNKEVVRNKVASENSVLNFREIGVRLDMIHEAERTGVRNLGERENRKLQRMLNEVERMMKAISVN
ncbi:hypothetical protein [Pontibacter sp. G13]|uniref:hypothetical protein n=1 Tax=Pontibacter sp. G13 TaxID=3074898 RepID=UPI002889C4F8|nr:hypothetical protein [Pontibacter sp. G13]WNJ20885.1 hypothetical protein RJD25_10435 [Pontibacter sp. G13]